MSDLVERLAVLAAPLSRNRRRRTPMTDITIPPEAVEAAAVELAPHPWSMYKDTAKDHFRDKARAAILAAINAWPGAAERRSWDGSIGRIILPLSQENTDAEAR